MSIGIDEILVVCDVDGTLLEAGYGLPKRNIDAIESYVFRGGKFTLATGRGIESVEHYSNYIRLSAPTLLCNGGMIYDFSNGRLLEECLLSDGAISIVHMLQSEFPDAGVAMMCGRKLYVTRMNEQMKGLIYQEHLSCVLTSEELLPERWNKIMFADKPENIDRFEEFCEEAFRNSGLYNDYSFMRTKDVYYEVNPVEASKATGLEKLCRITGIPMSRTVAICDYYNDIELLDAAAFSIVVDGAPGLVKEHADVVVSSCLSGGVADALKYIDTEKDSIFTTSTEEKENG